MTTIKKCAAFVLAPLVLALSPPTAPAEYYAQALAVMRTMPQPANVAASVTAVGHDVGVYVGPSQDAAHAGYASFKAGTDASAPAVSWSETFDSASDAASVDTQSAKALIGIGPLFNPTWTGAYDWLRYGLDGRPHANAAGAVPTFDPQLKTIATLTIMAPGAYRVSDAGSQQCPDGSPGRHLQFAAKDDWARHPLTDITVDERTMRFCSMRFRIDPKHIRGGTGTVQVDYGDVDGYWLLTHTSVDFLARLFGIGIHHFGVDFTYHVTKVQ
jgi:hypothetical protein